MKKTLFTCLTGIMLAWTITSVSYSQSSVRTEKFESSYEDFIPSSEERNAAKNSNATLPYEISTKAVRNFTRDFKNSSNVAWRKLDKGSVVYFTSDSIKTRVFYDKRGNFEAMIRDYSEDKLPREIRHLVKRTYYDFSIYYVNEVSIDGRTVYIVNMEDKTSVDKISWKTIKVIDGEMKVMKEYSERTNSR